MSAARGAAPFAVSFTASCAGASYHWDFGDGAAADGATASHTFGAGRFARARKSCLGQTRKYCHWPLLSLWQPPVLLMAAAGHSLTPESGA